MELLTSTSIRESKVRVRMYYQGSDKLAYEMFFKDKLLFKGNEYRPSPSRGIESIESVVGLLGFLTTKPGDTDDDYFKDYTPEQLEWCKTIECEHLSIWINDIEEGEDGEYYNVARKQFRHRTY